MGARITAEKINDASARVVAQAWSDPEFKARLISDPEAVLAEAGIPVPEGVELRVVEDTVNMRHFVLPGRPEDDELVDEVLERITAGVISLSNTDVDHIRTLGQN